MNRLITALAASLVLAGCGSAASSTQTPTADAETESSTVAVPAACLEALERADNVYSLAVEAQGIMVDTQIGLLFGGPSNSLKNKLLKDFDTYANDLSTAANLYRAARDDCREI